MTLKPVAWLTTFYSVLVAVLAANEAPGPMYHLIPATAAAIAGGVALVVGIVLGVKTYNRVTPVARPRALTGERLVPQGGVKTVTEKPRY